MLHTSLIARACGSLKKNKMIENAITSFIFCFTFLFSVGSFDSCLGYDCAYYNDIANGASGS